MNKIGIIGGSGFYEIPGVNFIEEIKLVTDYGAPSDSYLHYTFEGLELYFLSRHNRMHSIAPHTINYRANIDGFDRLGVRRILTISATGGISADLKPGDIVIPDNGIDLTSGRNSTYYDAGEIYHVDLTSPYCPGLRSQVVKASDNAGVVVRDGGVTICTNGPRMETASEIKAYRQWGADIVGMTLFPECVLAKEKGICYANISVVSNYAAGIKDTPLTTSEVIDVMNKSGGNVGKIVKSFLQIGSSYDCGCRLSKDETKISKA